MQNKTNHQLPTTNHQSPVTNHQSPITIHPNHSTTRFRYKLIDDEYLDEKGKIKGEYKFKINHPAMKIKHSKFIGNPEDKFQTMLFLPEGEGRKAEGGLRTRGYFKFSYVWCGDSDGDCVGDSGNGSKGRWWIADLDGNPIMPAPEEIQKQISQYINSLSSNTQSSGAVDTNSTSQTNLRVNCDGDGNISTFKDHNSPFTNHYSLLNKLPLITVITVVLNGEKYLEETIQSVINQTYPNVEYIIIDGGSTDGTLDIIKKYEDYIDYWVSEKDNGIYDAMNKGITLAMGNIIGIINSDDWYSFNALNLIYHAYMSISQKIGILHGDMNLIKDENKFFILRPYRNLKKIKKGMIINHPTVFVSRKIYLENGFFDINYKIVADWELMLRFYLHGIKFYKINTVLANFRIGGLSYNYNKKHIYEKHIVRKKYNLFKIVDTLYIYDLIKYYIFGNFISRLSLFKKYLLSKFQ
ncbi:glycosyltransferase family 2 protein [Deferribacter thermophilus]|uniref:glycosyltransferase family 2 protein n=1 Tax=Deferribacter thermophilus TaxID=53573 RepID=UPI003C1BC3B2